MWKFLIMLEVARIFLIFSSLIVTSYIRHHILLKIECELPDLFDVITEGKGGKWKGQNFKLIGPNELRVPWRVHLLIINGNASNIVSQPVKYVYIISLIVMVITMANVVYRLFD